jgi:DNA helicase HerA-like ATPase
MISRYNTVADSGLFTDEDTQSANLERLVSELGSGGALIVNMKNQYSVTRRMTVEIIINKLSDMLSSWKLRALFLFAEEAHLYLRETYWEDIVTRMRHLGIFTTFVTNQPDTIKESIYRQADNIFLFNFTNEHDLETVSRVAKIDVESVKLIAKDLPPHHCLTIGEIVKNFPIVVNVRRLNVETMGETRYFFRN